MRMIYPLTVLFASAALLQAQTDCPQFNPAVRVGTVAQAALAEISGIAASRQNADVLWAQDDSGDVNRVFAMTTAGTHLGTFYFAGVTATDWEDMAIGPGPMANQDYLYVADTGNNSLTRTTVTIYRVREPNLAAYALPVEAQLQGVEALPVRYPDTNRDVETLLVDPQTGDLVLLTRDRALTGTTHIYVYPAAEQTPGIVATLTYVGAIASNIEIKGGDVSADGNWVILRRHSTTSVADGWLWYRPTGTPLPSVFATAPCVVPLAAEPQGEAVAFTPDATGYFTISEGVSQPIYFHGPFTAPAGPATGTATAVSSTQINLAWTDSASNETGYQVERSTDGITYDTAVSLPANTTTFADSGLTPETTYWYRISAWNAAGSSASLVLTATTPVPPPPVPTAPASLTATAPSKSQINLRWTDTSSDEYGFKVERSTDGIRFSQIAVVSANATSYAATGLTAGKLYYFRVRAFNAGGDSAYSNVASARTPKK